jgi:hypothetical protein
VKARRVGNSLQMAGATQIGIVAGDGGVLPDGERRKRLRERVAEDRILRRAAVARPPTGVDRKLRKVGKPAKLVHSGRFATGQSTELVEVHSVRALGGEMKRAAAKKTMAIDLKEVLLPWTAKP